MTHKTKVIALRVTQDQYDALSVMANGRLMKMGEYVYNYLIPAMNQGADLLLKERKKAEAKAKRLAKKEAGNDLHA